MLGESNVNIKQRFELKISYMRQTENVHKLENIGHTDPIICVCLALV